MSISLQIKRLTETAKLPTHATAEAAGMDLTADESVTIPPGEWRAVSTGLSMALEPFTEAQIRPRSGMAAMYGVTVLNAPGTIDSDYRGEVKVLLINHGKTPFNVFRGDRIAQMVIDRVFAVHVYENGELPPSGRGTGGFGSTGT